MDRSITFAVLEALGNAANFNNNVGRLCTVIGHNGHRRWLVIESTADGYLTVYDTIHGSAASLTMPLDRITDLY